MKKIIIAALALGMVYVVACDNEPSATYPWGGDYHAWYYDHPDAVAPDAGADASIDH